MSDVRKRMQAVLLIVACAAGIACAQGADKTVERWMSTTVQEPQTVFPTMPPEAEREIQSSARGKLDLNTADAWMLTAIPGVGDAIAGRIIAYREKNGGFMDIRELTRIDGIGEKLFAVMREYVQIGNGEPEAEEAQSVQQKNENPA